jgi:cell division protein FtsI/penicillin-binding protein 2
MPDLAGPPGSTLKPLVLQSLIERGRLTAEETFLCPRDLRLHGRSFACTHPPMLPPMTVRTAIAYSCNCFVAHVAVRLDAGDLEAWGIASRSPLGEDGLATPASLAAAYARVAGRASTAVKAGMEDAVQYGTAQRAQVTGLTIAGKTGSAGRSAWFAGFTDTVVIAVLVQGRSGGADAAPVAARILEAHARGRV